MKIHSIHIENYRQYKGPIDINFSLNEEKNFTVIEGTNGAGKTNLLNAITWCLYEEELHKSSNDSGDVIYNSITKNETAYGGSFEVKVTVVLIDAYGIKTNITRSLVFSRDNKGNVTRPPNSEFVITNDIGGDEPLERPNLFIKSEFPQDIEGYFFFDGEKLEDYFDDNSGNTIEDSVYQLAQLNLIDEALENLNKSKRYYTQQISKLDKKLAEKLSNRSNLEALLRKYSAEKKDANKTIDTCKNKLVELRDQLKLYDHSDIKELEKERVRLEKNKALLIKNIDKDTASKRKLIIKNFPIVSAFNIMNDAKNLCKNTKNEDVANALYSKELLEHILSENKCICGCDLSKDEHAHHIINELVKSSNNSSNLSSEIKNLLRNLNISLLEIEDVNDKIKEYDDNIVSYKYDLKEVSDDLEDNEFKRGKIDESEIRKLNSEINKVEREKDTAISKKASAENNYKRTKEKLDKLEIKERHRKINNIAVNKLRNYEEFCRQAMLNLETLKSNLSREIRKKLEEETTEQFLRLMWKDNYEKVLINNSYDVKLKNVFGELVPTTRLSAGEKLALALSFVSALNNISGFDLPILIDTPTGRLGTDIKNSVAETLPVYLNDKQVTLLVTDEEYNDNFRDRILNKVDVEYKIEYHKSDNGEESRIVLNDR